MVAHRCLQLLSRGALADAAASQQPPGGSGSCVRAGASAGGALGGLGGLSADFDDLASFGSPRALDSHGGSVGGASDAAAAECGPVELAEAAAVAARPAQVLRLLQVRLQLAVSGAVGRWGARVCVLYTAHHSELVEEVERNVCRSNIHGAVVA